MCCDSWGCKELDTTKLNRTEALMILVPLLNHSTLQIPSKDLSETVSYCKKWNTPIGLSPVKALILSYEL